MTDDLSKLEAIVAMAQNRVIGRDNQLPWRLSADLKRFKALTLGQVLVMGRKTYESIGRPLPGRATWVLTRQAGWSVSSPEVTVLGNLEAAVERARRDERRVIIAGGETLYREALPLIGQLHLTVIERDFEGDAIFPPIDLSQWTCVEQNRHWDEALSCHYRFESWRR